MSNAVEKTEVCKKQTSVILLLEFSDQCVQHIHHLTLPSGESVFKRSESSVARSIVAAFKLS